MCGVIKYFLKALTDSTQTITHQRHRQEGNEEAKHLQLKGIVRYDTK